MIKVENIEVWGFEHAIRGMRAKSYRPKRNGRYEAFVSDKGKSVHIGTFTNSKDADHAVEEYRIKRFCKCVREFGDEPEQGVVFEEDYVVFPSGNIYNLHGRKIEGMVDRWGYRQVILHGNNMLAHRVVAKSFIENPNNYEQVNHKNGNKTDNRVSNLEWCTRSENLLHAYSTGLERKVCGEMHHASKLNDDAVRYIRSVYKKHDRKYGSKALSKMFGVDRSTISDVANGKTWRHVS